ncbi:hypothetical protein B9479_003567 [Cryptococcus floricola]|uniref:Uncharacterized protein n=1 Tax=Cryptococcus floricola TaxID=2591691 RepID=A0A5D3AZV3_9TREE|nr:hypothetical protein B9479_003567 [Cryptococcus floricola]
MFWRKKQAAPPSLPNYLPKSNEPPRPILKKNSDDQAGNGLRFAGGTKADSPLSSPGVYPTRPQPPVQSYSPENKNATRQVQPSTPRVVVSSYGINSAPSTPVTQHPTSPSNSSPGAESISPARVLSRRSSRATSPSVTSFGTRVRVSTEQVRSASPYRAVSTPPQQSSSPVSAGFSTPPTQYSPSSYGATPPSPYRRTNDREGHSPSPMATFVEKARLPVFAGTFMEEDEADESDSDVPMLNIIPATPQDQEEAFPPKATAPEARVLDHGVNLEEKMREMEREMVDVSLDEESEEKRSWEREGVPTIDLDFDFAPLESVIDWSQPSEDDEDSQIHSDEPEGYDTYEDSGFSHDRPPSEPLPPSPPFHSYPSLPSLDSETSLSSPTMPNSSSMSSLASYPDVEQVLGSMLASLSESSMASTTIDTPREQSFDFGNEIPLDFDALQAETTAPLSLSRPSSRVRSHHIPSPLDLSNSKYGQVLPQETQSAPLANHRNHRIRYYPNARIHPSASPSGVFTTVTPSSSESSMVSCDQRSGATPTPTVAVIPASASESELGSMQSNRSSKSYRDSCSGSEMSDDDEIYTASIMSVTPVVVAGGRMGGKTAEASTPQQKKERGIVFGGHFVKERMEMGCGLGLGLEVETEEVGLAL